MVELNINIEQGEEKKTVPKSNSGCNIFSKSFMDKPGVKSLISGVSTVLQSQMVEDCKLGKKLNPTSENYFFSEEKYIKEKPDQFDDARLTLLRTTPSVENIYEFIKALFDCAQFSPECCVVALVYINRIIAFSVDMPLHPTNWRPLILCSLLVAQKV